MVIDFVGVPTLHFELPDAPDYTYTLKYILYSLFFCVFICSSYSVFSIDKTDNGCLTKGINFSFLLPLLSIAYRASVFHATCVESTLLNVDTKIEK